MLEEENAARMCKCLSLWFGAGACATVCFLCMCVPVCLWSCACVLMCVYVCALLLRSRLSVLSVVFVCLSEWVCSRLRWLSFLHAYLWVSVFVCLPRLQSPHQQITTYRVLSYTDETFVVGPRRASLAGDYISDGRPFSVCGHVCVAEGLE